MTTFKKFALSATVLGGLALTTACTPSIHTRGNLVPDSKIAKVQPNVTSQYDLAQLWGPPTIIAPFEDEQVWYYAGHTSERLGIFKYEITERKIIRVAFDENGIVKELRELDPANAQDVEFVQRETPTAGKEFTILQQFVGNIGRFSGASSLPVDQAGNQ